MLVDDVVGTGSGRYSSPRHWMPTHSRNEGSNCVSMRWRAMICRPYMGAATASLKSLARHYPADSLTLALERGRVAVGPARYCSQRHPTCFEPSGFELYGVL